MPSKASQFKSILLAAVIFLGSSGTAFSQVQVVEAGANNYQTSTNTTQSASAGNQSVNNEVQVMLYNMVEALQREVQTLRGLVEEQTYQIRRMENEQRDRYLDVDNRISELNQRITSGIAGLDFNSGGQVFDFPGSLDEPTALESAAQTALNPNGNSTAANNAGFPVSGETPGQDIPLTGNNSQSTIALNDSANVEPRSEEELYQDARNLLLNDAEFEASIQVFQQMIEEYPQGRLAPNAYYWQGEALILVERYSQAINVFNQVVDSFPNHEKAPDSMLKLGIVYSLMGNERRAQQVWRELLQGFAESGSASLRLAEVYLREGYNR